MAYHALERRVGIWNVVGFQVWGPPAGLVSRVYLPASSDKPAGSESSAALQRASQTFC